ncbi:MAG: toll/interleukin-1 receptor domain-containing protein [Armatimonadota bacterium]
MKRQPAAFMSYVRADDKYGHLTEFLERLSEEVRAQTGEEFPVFQDRNDIQWGENWRERIEESLDAVTFLIPIITPSFLRSEPCREEFRRFLGREAELKRNDLILPVYYVDAPLLNDEASRATDEIARVVTTRQYADWRELRFEPLTSPEVRRTLARLAIQVRMALERAGALSKTAVGPPVGKRRIRTGRETAGTARRQARESSVAVPEGAESAVQGGKDARGTAAKTEPPTRW